MSAWLKRVLHALWLASAALLILLAALVAAGRMFLPLVDAHREEIRARIEASLGVPVRLEGLELRWSGLWPELELRGLALPAAGGEPWLAMDRLRVSVDLWGSLRKHRLDPVVVELFGLRADLQRTPAGGVILARLPEALVADADRARLWLWLLGRDRIVLHGARIGWLDPAGSRVLDITGVDAAWLRVRSGFELEARLAVAREQREAGSLALHARILQADGWVHEARLRGSLNLPAPMLPGRWEIGDDGLRLQRGRVHFSLWTRGRGLALERVTADLAAEDLELGSSPAAAPAVRVPRGSARVFWRRSDAGWRLAIERLRLDMPEGLLAHSAIRVLRRDVGETAVYEAEAVEGDLALVRALAPVYPARWREAVQGLAPHGRLRDLRLRLQRDAGGRLAGWGFHGRVLGAAWRPWRRVPGVEGLDLEIRGGPRGGEATLVQEDGTVDLPRLFTSRLGVRSLRARARWRREPDGWHLEVPAWRLQAPGIDARGRVGLVLAPGREPFVDVGVDLNRAEVAEARRYLPRRILPPPVQVWLDRALAGGEVSSGHLVFFGRPSRFPFAGNEGVFDATFRVRGLRLDYAPGWMPVEQGVARVRFHNAGFRAEVEAAVLGQAPVGPVAVEIPRLGRRSLLRLQGRARGDLAPMLDYVRAMPVLGAAREALGQMAGRGPALLDLALELPLYRDPGRTRVDGTLRMEGATLDLSRWHRRLEALRGPLRFHYRQRRLGFESDGIRASSDGRPVALQVATDPAGTRVTVHARSRGEAGALFPEIPPLIVSRLHGSAAWDVAVLLPIGGGDEAPVEVEVRSDLSGLAVELPDDFAKAASESRPLLARLRFRGGRLERLHVDLGRRLCMDLAVTGSGPPAVSAYLGPHGEGAAADHGIRVEGRLLRFTVEAWLALWREFVAGGAAAPAGKEAGVEGWLRHADIEVGELRWAGQSFAAVQLSVRPADTGWSLRLAGESIAGRVEIPAGGVEAPLRVELERMYLQPPAGDGDGTPVPEPGTLPPVTIRVADLRVGEMPLGELRASLAPGPEGLVLERAVLKSGLFEAEGEGVWQSRGELAETNVELKVAGDDLGALLQRAGYQDAVRGGRFSVRLRLRWPGSPGRFSLTTLQGELSLRIRKGELLPVDPGGGRVFGLLSLQALPRRLSLDFRDIFAPGLRFDLIQGHFTIDGGDAYTNDLLLDGPVATIEIAGRTGLVTRDYDQRALVTPRISSSIPLIGGLAGGPGVAVGLWAANKLLGRRIDELSRIEYAITGSWDAPVVERLDLEDQVPSEEDLLWEEDEG